MVQALGVPGCRATAAGGLDGGPMLSVERRGRGGRCPGCGRPSRAGHGRYGRRPADLPCLGRPVRLDPEARRFRCASMACPHRTFAERLPPIVSRRARQTRRLAEARRRTGFATSAAAGARLMRASGVPASTSTVLRPIARRGRASGGDTS